MLTSTFQCTECGQAVRGSAGLGLCGACALRGAIDLQNSRGEERAVDGPGDPKRFGDYDLLEELARGGMGVIYRARQRSLGREIALKVLLGGAFAGEDGKRRLQAEAAAAAQLRHPNIVPIHDAGMVDGQPFFSMTLVKGPTLAEAVRTGPLPARRAARYVARIAEAVHHAHTQGVLHRDLKPSNVLLDSNDEPQVTDFGLAKSFVSAQTRSPAPPTGQNASSADLVDDPSPSIGGVPARRDLTLTGQVLGSPAYMPPEQALGRGRELGPASDVYSLGAILYELLTGRPPFSGETPHSVMEQVKSLDPIPVRRLNPDIPVDLETVCLKCLEKESHRRYATARELAEELTRYLNGEMVRARAVGSVGRLLRMACRHPWPTTAIVLAVAMLVGTGGMLAWKARTERLHSEALLKEQAATRLVMMRSQLGEARAVIRNRQADSRQQAEAILARLLEENPPPDLRGEARDLALAAWALPSAYTEPLPGDGVNTEDWTLAAGDLPRKHWALATFRGRVVLRSIDSETNLMEFTTAPRVVTALIAFSPGGRWLAIRHRDELGIWDTAPGVTQRLAFVTKAWGNGIRFGFGKTAFALDDGAVLWADRNAIVASALPGGDELARWTNANGGPRHIEALATASDGQSFAVAYSGLPTIEVRSWPQGQVERTLTNHSSRGVSALALTTKSGWLAVGDSNGRVSAFEIDRRPDPVFEFSGHAEGIRALTFTANGRYLCSSSEDETVRLWDCVTGANVATVPFEGAVMSFATDWQSFGVGSTIGRLSVVSLEPSPILHRFRAGAPSSNPQMLSFHPDSRSLFCLTDGGAMRCSVPDGVSLAFFPSPGARNLIAEPAEKDGLIITGTAGLTRHSLTEPKDAVTLMPGTGNGWGGPSISADGFWLAACNKGPGLTAVWPAGDRDGRRFKLIPGGSGGGEAALSPDGSQVAVNDHYGPDVMVFNATQGTLLRKLPLPARHAIAWSPDGRWLAGIGTGFHLWDTASWKLIDLPSFQPNVAAFTAVAFSWPQTQGQSGARSRYLAITSGSTRIALVDLAERTVVATLEAPQARPIYKMSFSHDGHWLAAAVASGEIQLWDISAIRTRLQSADFSLAPR